MSTVFTKSLRNGAMLGVLLSTTASIAPFRRDFVKTVDMKRTPLGAMTKPSPGRHHGRNLRDVNRKNYFSMFYGNISFRSDLYTGDLAVVRIAAKVGVVPEKGRTGIKA